MGDDSIKTRFEGGIKIVLHGPVTDTGVLSELVEAWIIDGATLIAVVGREAGSIHDLIDELILGNGGDESRFIVTTWHDDEPLEDVVKFVEGFGGGRIEHVKL